MAFALMIFITWVIISVYFLVPKRLNVQENILLFLFYTIIIINIFTILDLNLKIIQHNNQPELFIGFWLHRNIIIPILLIVFVNFISSSMNRIKKFMATFLIFCVLYLIELLTFWIGIETSSRWNIYLSSAIIKVVLMLLAFFIMKLVTKLPERMST